MDWITIAIALMLGSADPSTDLRKETPVPAVAYTLLQEVAPAETPPILTLGPVTKAGPLEERKALVESALDKEGVPYVWAGASPSGYDCSGFLFSVFAEKGLELPRMADEQFAAGVPVEEEDILPGDMVFFETYMPGPSHSGIYVGDNKFVHASSGAKSVTVTALDKAYYAERFLGARRHPDWAR